MADSLTFLLPPRIDTRSLLNLFLKASDIERRAQSMKDKIEGKGQHEVKRESWMLELPDAKAKSFGLGPRTFSRKGKTELGDRSVWTESPEDKARRARGEQVEGGNEDEEEKKRQEYLINKSRYKSRWTQLAKLPPYFFQKGGKLPRGTGE